MPEWQVVQVAEPLRLDQLLVRQWPALNPTTIRRMIAQRSVVVNERPALKPGQRLRPQDEVRVRPPDMPEPSGAQGTAHLPHLPIAYEDEAVLIVDKPAGVSVRRHRGVSEAQPLPVPQLLGRMRPDLAHVGGAGRAGVVTTLAAECSGLLLSGKTEETYRKLRRLTKRSLVVEGYSVLVEGRLRSEYTIDEPIGNMRHTRRRLAVTREGRPASTYVRPQQHYKEGGRDFTLAYVRPQTSRMHQIRVHLSWFGFPVVGDLAYGARYKDMLYGRIFLHLSEMTLQHPATGIEIEAASPLPQELFSILQFLRRPK